MKNKFSSALSLAMIVAMLFTSVALADNVVNDVIVDPTITTASSTMADYKIVATGGDGQGGCNASDGSPVTITIVKPAAVTATPSSLSFTSCGTEQSVVFTANAAGDYAISASASDAGAGTYSTTPAGFTLHVQAPPNTAPSVSVTGVTNGSSYNKGSVPAAGCSVTDAEDEPSSFAATLSAVTGLYASDGIGSQTASCSYTDAGGLTATDSATYDIVDPSAPSIGYALAPVSPDGSNGWYKSSVSLTWNVSEPESPNSLSKTDCVDQNITADQAETSYSCSATSAGGSAGPVSVSIKRDATAPSVSLAGGPADGGSYYFGSVPAAPTCSASDALSGLDGSCGVSGYSALVGSHTVTASATDKAGNSASASATYTVLAWTIGGFYQPVDMGGVLNTVKGGSTVPLKFKVFAGTTELTDTAIVSTLVKLVTCNAVAGEDTIEVLATGGTSLRYDAVGGQFIFNWQTPKLPGKCYSVTMTTQDGSSITALFKLK
jgi:hypothetical protein